MFTKKYCKMYANVYTYILLLLLLLALKIYSICKVSSKVIGLSNDYFKNYKKAIYHAINMLRRLHWQNTTILLNSKCVSNIILRDNAILATEKKAWFW